VPSYDYRTPRLFVEEALETKQQLTLNKDQAHYLINVLRLDPGASVLVFNGRDGEWLATRGLSTRKIAVLDLIEQTRPQPRRGSIQFLFAPLKHARLDYLIQKAVEMGADRIRPVITKHTQVTRLNLGRMRANIIEASEQCGILTVPELLPEMHLDDLLATWDTSETLIFCDERADIQNPIASLQITSIASAAILIGPEGGFSDQERENLMKIQSVIRLSLGPRILRADTAAVAALALVQATHGDWR
jgi:16S rRNA (uracil1498-N3)-methyltransferase